MDQTSWAAPVAAAAVTALGALATWFLARRSDLVNELRKALDRGRIRENALVVCCDLLIFAIDHLEERTPAVMELRARAHAVLVDARSHTHGKEGD